MSLFLFYHFHLPRNLSTSISQFIWHSSVILFYYAQAPYCERVVHPGIQIAKPLWESLNRRIWQSRFLIYKRGVDWFEVTIGRSAINSLINVKTLIHKKNINLNISITRHTIEKVKWCWSFLMIPFHWFS